MKQRAHAWVALRALKLVDDSGRAPKLVELLSYYLSDVWEGAWLPDTLIVDMRYGHTYKMDSDPAMLGFDVTKEDWLRTPYKQLKSRLKGKRLCLKYIKDEEELNAPYKSHPEKGGHLPNRVIALSQTTGDMLKMADFPIAFYTKEKRASSYKKTLTKQKVKDLSLSPNFSARQIALAFFMLSHYICDAHMPLHCDLRDYGGKRDKLRRLPKTLHPSIEEEWEKHFPEKETLTLHDQTKQSVDEIIKTLPEDSIIQTESSSEYALDGKLPIITQDEWLEMVHVARVSYALSRKWIPSPYNDVKELMEDRGEDEFQKVTNCIFHDAVQSVAAIWYKCWYRFIT
ncbi:MAG: hypothetical protein QMD08_05460 [Actinomycetota bacterium]|nr:hypothetical protein [Actinomycetota bacterium]